MIEDHEQKISTNEDQSLDETTNEEFDDTPFNIPKPKEFDLKSFWLKDTEESLKKFDKKYQEVKKYQNKIEEEFKKFAQNQNKYRISSLRKIDQTFDHKKIYQEYLKKSRKLIQKINPALFLNIVSYSTSNVFLQMTKLRRISKIFNEIYKSEQIQYFMAQRDYLYEEDGNPMKTSVEMCRKFMQFHKTFLYYKAIQYTEQIPQNSIKLDLHEAVKFINEVHKLAYKRKCWNFTYYKLMNTFMKKHRVVIGLSSLSLSSLVLVRKAAIIAFSNYLAFNQSQRSKEEITKTKYSQVIQVVEKEDYKDTLILNTKVAIYLWENHAMSFSVFISNQEIVADYMPVKSWNILVFHLHNELKTTYLQDIQLKQGKFQSAKIDLFFGEDMSTCLFATVQYTSWIKIQMPGTKMISLTKLESRRSKEDSLEDNFGVCYFFYGEQYYIIAMPSQYDF